MSQLPLLIKELIEWYIWKAKIKECNQEYHKVVKSDPIYEQNNPIYLIKLHPIDEEFPQYYREFQYRDLLDTVDVPGIFLSIYNFTSYRERKVAILPKRYFYSSGTSPQGV
jgi:hypothetical protein